MDWAESAGSAEPEESFTSPAPTADRGDEGPSHRGRTALTWEKSLRWMGRIGWAAFLSATMVGCASYPRAQNPLPGVFRVAVVDFVDKTNGAPGLDRQKVTEIFASELQKVPTYEVVPVQEVREVLGPAMLDTNQPQLAFELARAVHAQAIIVGSINEYNANYPPRLALHCEMYAMVTGQPEAVVVSPPPQLEPNRRPVADLLSPLGVVAVPFDRAGQRIEKIKHKHGCGHCAGCRAGFGCQHHGFGWPWCGWKRGCTTIDEETPTSPGSETSGKDEVPVPNEPPETARRDERLRRVSAEEPVPPEGSVAAPDAASAAYAGGESFPPDDTAILSSSGRVIEPAEATAQQFLSGQVPAYQVSIRPAVDPIPVVEPWVIRHSRVFDSTNIGLTRKLRDYYFFNDDLRGGNWQGYVFRNDDFIRFSSNQMIYEMLEAAGGSWLTLRGVRLPKPWLPWPPR